MRDEAPLYYNERYDFCALSRFDDVVVCALDWRTCAAALDPLVGSDGFDFVRD